MSRPQQVQPHAPPTTTPAQKLLLDFLRDHDAACPVCRYNLRALTTPICPECHQHLTLTVGVTHLRLGWLFAALAPGFFSGIAACFVLIPIIGVFLEDAIIIWPFVVLDLFGWCSGTFAIMLAIKRHRFLAMPRPGQRWFAFIIWLIHIIALALFILYATRFL
jgi:hypothetical protein